MKSQNGLDFRQHAFTPSPQEVEIVPSMPGTEMDFARQIMGALAAAEAQQKCEIELQFAKIVLRPRKQ